VTAVGWILVFAFWLEALVLLLFMEPAGAIAVAALTSLVLGPLLSWYAGRVRNR
jgi:hypothetical protein